METVIAMIGKCILITALAVLIGFYLPQAGNAQQVAEPNFLPAYQQELWGFADLDGNVIIDYQYEEAKLPQGDYAIVNKAGKWGVINRQGQATVPLNFQEVIFFDANHVRVQHYGRYGLYTITGKEILAPECLELGPVKVKDSVACFRMTCNDGKMGVYLPRSEKVIQCRFDYVAYSVASDGTLEAGEDGKRMRIRVFPNPYAGEVKTKKATASQGEQFVQLKESGKWQCQDKDGNLIGPTYDHFFHDDGNVFIVGEIDSVIIGWGGATRPVYAYFFTDRQGEKLSGPYQGIKIDSRTERYGDGYYIVKSNGKSGFITAKGNVLFPFEYEEMYLLDSNLVQASKNGLFGIVDRSGKMIVPFKYEEIHSYLNRPGNIPFYKTYVQGLYGLVALDGTEIIPPKYRDIEPFSRSSRGNRSQGDLIEVQNDVYPGKEGYGLKGYINEQGEEIIPPIYRYVSPLKDSVVPVQRTYESEQEYIVLAHIDHEPPTGVVITAVWEEAIQVKSDTSYGVVNRQGKQIVPAEFERINRIEIDGSLYYIVQNHNGFSGVYSHTGEVLVPCQYVHVIWTFGNHYFSVRYKDSPTYYYTIAGKALYELNSN